jgi:sec-independent protein translocase protein TatA
MFGSVGLPELIIIFVVALLVFGPRKLPEIGKTLGGALREFRRATNELKNTLEDEVRVDETRRTIVDPVMNMQNPVAPAAPAVPPEADAAGTEPATPKTAENA